MTEQHRLQCQHRLSIALPGHDFSSILPCGLQHGASSPESTLRKTNMKPEKGVLKQDTGLWGSELAIRPGRALFPSLHGLPEFRANARNTRTWKTTTRWQEIMLAFPTSTLVVTRCRTIVAHLSVWCPSFVLTHQAKLEDSCCPSWPIVSAPAVLVLGSGEWKCSRTAGRPHLPREGGGVSRRPVGHRVRR